MRILKYFLLLLNVALAIMLLLSYFSPQTSPADYPIISLFGLLYPYILVANLLLIILWLFIDYRGVLLSSVVILGGWSYLQTIFTINTFEPATDKDINIMSYNISNGTYYNKDNKNVNSDVEDLARTIEQQSYLNLLCIQETSPKMNTQFFKKRFPEFQKVIDADKRAMIFTKLPIVNSGYIEFGHKTNSCVWADIEYNNMIVRVYSLHLQSNSLTKYKNQTIKNADIREPAFWERVVELFRRYKNSSIIRNEQARMVVEHMRTSKHPIILCGDFNDTPLSHTYYIFNQHLRDAYRDKGSGLGSTFRENIPLLRIDFIMYSESLHSKRFSIGKGDFSDHYPIFATYSVN